jgi:hypothetical protein
MSQITLSGDLAFYLEERSKKMLRENIIIALFIFFIIILFGCAGTRNQQADKAAQLDKYHFKSTCILKDDALDTIATFSTVNGLKEKHGLLQLVWNDNFLRAFVDKKTGATEFQVYNVIWYQGSNWRFYYQANYETPGGPETCELTSISRDVDCTGSKYGGCRYNEHVGFLVEEELLRKIAEVHATTWQPGMKVGWKYKLKAQAGPDYQDGILPAEVVGLLERVDEYKMSKGLK